MGRKEQQDFEKKVSTRIKEEMEAFIADNKRSVENEIKKEIKKERDARVIKHEELIKKLTSLKNTQNAMSNLFSLDQPVIRTSISLLKIILSLWLLLISYFLVLNASDKYENASADISKATVSAINTYYRIIFELKKDKVELHALEKEYMKQQLECQVAKNNLGSSTNVSSRIITNESDSNAALTGYKPIVAKENKKEQICNRERELEREIRDLQNENKLVFDSISQLNPRVLIHNNKVNSAYMLFFFSILTFISAIFIFISFLKSRQRSLAIRMKKDQYDRFIMALDQCDKLKQDEEDPKHLLTSVLNSIKEISKREELKDKEIADLFSLLGKLKIPQRQSVEVRAELIKKIYQNDEALTS